MEKDPKEWVSLEGWQQRLPRTKWPRGPRSQAELDLCIWIEGLPLTPADLLPSRASQGIGALTSSASGFCSLVESHMAQ